jgi:hypothetical protein
MINAAPMAQFYVWEVRGVRYLCLRDCQDPFFGYDLGELLP